MTDDERKQEGAEQEIEDLEAPATVQMDVAGGMGPCKPTNACAPVNTVVQTCKSPTQQCIPSPDGKNTCAVTLVYELPM